MKKSDRISARLLRGIAHIERTIDTGTSLADIASTAALSEFHFHRQFRARFGVPVMDYVRRRRIAVAAQALLGSRTPILHIALEVGFQSQAAFTRAFSKVFHTTPAQYRRRGREVPWFTSAPISDEVVAMLPGLGSTQPRLEKIDRFAVEGLVATMDGAGRKAIPQLWESLANVVGRERFDHEERFGISESGAAATEGILGFVAAVKADEDAAPNPLLERRIIPGGSYLVFQVAGGAKLIAAAYDFLCATWLPGIRPRFRFGPSFATERHPDETGRPQTAEIWIPVEDM